MIHQVIQIILSKLAMIFQIYCSYKTFLILFYVYCMLRFDKPTYPSLLFEFIFSVGLSNTQCGSDVLLFLEFINAVFILYYTFIEFMIFLYTF